MLAPAEPRLHVDNTSVYRRFWPTLYVKALTGERGMHPSAQQPNDLEKYFVERANAGDVDGLVALYEPQAMLVSGDGSTSPWIDDRDFERSDVV